ncbi:heme-binding protein [Rhizobium sp. P40RR-XXII]|nr:heme-binding protein [Rhizobium sp. P40RR-XXII]
MKTFLPTAAIGALAASPLLAQDTVQKVSLKARLADNIAEMAVVECAVDGDSVSAAVTDQSGVLRALVRSENVGAHTADASTQKAFTSASSRSLTSAKDENVAGNPRAAGLTDVPGLPRLSRRRPDQGRRGDDRRGRCRGRAEWRLGRKLREHCNRGSQKPAQVRSLTTIRFLRPTCRGPGYFGDWL